MKRILTTLLLLLCAAPALFAQTRSELLKKAQAGDAEAQYKLGTCYDYGQLEWNGDFDAVSPDYDAAEKWYLRAAAQGYGRAYFDLGLLYQYNKKDSQKAVKWLKKYADYTYVERGEAAPAAIECLKELGVDCDPVTGRTLYASTGTSGSSSSGTSSGSSGRLLAKGKYTVSSQGRSQNTGRYTGVAGPDFTVDVEFYDDHIVVMGTEYEYKGTSNGWKIYEADNWLGGYVHVLRG